MVELVEGIRHDQTEVDELVHTAENGRGTESAWCIRALAIRGEIPILIGLANSDFERTKSFAINALAEFGDARALPALIVISETNWNSIERGKAKQGVERIKNDLLEAAAFLKKSGKADTRDIEAHALAAAQKRRKDAPVRQYTGLSMIGGGL